MTGRPLDRYRIDESLVGGSEAVPAFGFALTREWDWVALIRCPWIRCQQVSSTLGLLPGDE
jgi:hypothetical protein